MKTIYSLTLSLLFFSTTFCQQIFTTDYTALTVPQHYEGQIWHIKSDKTQEIVDVKTLPNDKTLLSSFPNVVSNVTVYQVSQEGDLTVFGVGISGKNENYIVIYDFSQTQTLIWDDNGTPESALVGVGVRMVAKVKTKKAGINLTSPFSLTANLKKIEGSLEVRVSGISSQKINSLIPTTTDLSPSSISVALQAVATIKSHIYDNDTIITPQYLAHNRRDGEFRTENIRFEGNEPK